MGRRASPGHLVAVERALPEDVWAALAVLARHLGLPPEDWRNCPPLREVGETAAFVARVAARVAEGCPRERALLDIGEELGLDGETVARRLGRWR